MARKIIISPSILSADFSKLQKSINSVRNADYLHIDVMDGHFAPNISIGPCVIKNIKTKLIKDVHLMIENPNMYINAFADAGADIITVHADACRNLKTTIKKIKALGKKAGVALNPNKSIQLIKHVLKDVDMVLVMSVYAGFSGQKFMPSILKKIKSLRKIYDGDIEVDGGITDKTIMNAAKAGANVFVAGSFVFNSKSHSKKIALLRKKAHVL